MTNSSITLSDEQQPVLDYVKTLFTENKSDTVLINSVAGSGKTTVLRAIAQTFPDKKGLYLAYNKAIAVSAAKKFSTAVCRTTHSLAYRAVVIPNDYKVGSFAYGAITEDIDPCQKSLLVDDIQEYSLSAFTSYEDYAAHNNRPNIKLAKKYLGLMESGDIPLTHDYYLKLFHLLLLRGEYSDSYDYVMLDEAGDLNEVTLEIFKLLPAPVKIAVGDPNQNIYQFNHTINCFSRLKGQGTEFKLSQSFRVPVDIAQQVQGFCRSYLDPDMVFKGIEPKSTEITTRAYISRTNVSLINKMIELDQEGIDYTLVRKASEIFKLPLAIGTLKFKGKPFYEAYQHYQDTYDEYYMNVNNVQHKYKSPFAYLQSTYPEDRPLAQACQLLRTYSVSKLFDAAKKAKSKENRKSVHLTLLTAHSSKGLEFDQVLISPDLNASAAAAISSLADPETKTADAEENLNLYYVACTRALVSLVNATCL